MRRRELSLEFLLLFLVTLCVSSQPAFAINARVLRQDVKPATQKMLEHQEIDNAVVADNDRIKTTFAGATSAAAVTLTSFTAQPDVARNITITPTGTTGDVEACEITVTGTNIFGRAISEVITFEADASAVVAGAKAFKTVTSVAWPADCESGGFAATWIIGVGDVLGLKRCMAQAGDLAWTVFDGAYETTRATVTASATAVESNTIDINGTLNGAKDIDAYFIQNWACLP